MFGELAVLRWLEVDGWEGVWLDTFHGRKTWRQMPTAAAPAILPASAQALYDRIVRENGGRASGAADAGVSENDLFIVTAASQMPRMPPWLITLPDFSLRPWTRDDAPSLARTLSASDAHLRAFTPWVVDGRVPGASLEDRLAKHAADFAAGTEWVYGMFSPDDSEVLGGCGLYPRVGPGAVEIGYWLAVHHTGRGLATQAAEALTQVAFDVLRVDRIEIRCDRDNVASVRIPERLGYRLVDAADAPANLLVFSRSRTDAPDGAA